MNKQALAALVAGAEKWDRNALAVNPEDATIYANSCELCQLFIMNDSCEGCPVAKAGFAGCIGSPWERAPDALDDWFESVGPDRKNAKARFRRAAKAEAKFLRSLIPAENDKEKVV